VTTENEVWDVIVVGSGASGLAAAVTAASPGSRVLVLEKTALLGGTTALAIGSVTAAGTRLQIGAGVNDTPEAFFDDLLRAMTESGLKNKNNEALTRIVAREAAPAVDWMAGLGAAFVGPFGEPPHRVPRMHNIVPNSKSYISVLSQAARKKGVAIRTGVEVTRLNTSGEAVIGVETHSPEGAKPLRATKAVILATGDFSSNRKMKCQFMSERLAQVDGINPSSTGDGHLMGMAINANVYNMDVSTGPNLRFVSPTQPLWIESLPTFPSLAKIMGTVAKHAPKGFFRFIAKRFLTVHTSPSSDVFKMGALLINKNGKRFTNELLPSRELAVAVAEQPQKVAYIVIDDPLARVLSVPPHYISTAPGIAYATFTDYRILRKDITFEAKTIPELAGKVGIDPAALEETVIRYNRAASGADEDDFGRKSFGQGCGRGPYYVMGPLMGSFSTVEGGLAVDSVCRVLTKDGKTIPGLYAVGSTGQGGLVLPGHGMHIAWALVSGRLAGRNAMGG
jgi:succinate dehydrogenase/fumarate reductase flavoprotein subunit